MANRLTVTDRVLTLGRRVGILTVQDLKKAGIHPEYLRRLYMRGLVQRIGRGRYVLADAPTSEHHDLALTARSAPRGIICLVSALSYHKIGTQTPSEVWLAIERRSAYPRIKMPKLRVFRFSGTAYTEGIEIHCADKVDVKIYSVAKTIADCFKYRNKVGIDVAVEALREVVETSRCKISEFDPYAKSSRVQNVMRPYIEALI